MSGFYRARLIDFRMGIRTALIGIPAALVGVLLAYRLDEAVLLLVVALAMPTLAWYIRHPPRAKEDGNGRNRKLVRTVKRVRPVYRCAATRVRTCTPATTRQLL